MKVNTEREQSLKHDEAVSLLKYDQDTGIFYWRKSGKIAGAITSDGYINICINYKRISAGRLAWFYVYGSFPKEQIDHINRNKQDNRIVNLREVNHAVNQRNRKLPPSNTGFKGVYKNANGKPGYRVFIRNGERQVYIGHFLEVEKAKQAYAQAVLEYHK